MRSGGTTGTATTSLELGPGFVGQLSSACQVMGSQYAGHRAELGSLGLWGGTKGKDRVGLS